MNEFDLIKAKFRPLTQDRAEAGGLLDDAAVLNIPDGFDPVVSSDMLNEGVHFFADDASDVIARKALRANISDIAAMGARPYCYQLSLGFPDTPDASWIDGFVAALASDQREFGLFCSGGDTTLTTGGLSISITIIGLAEHGKAVKRSGAQVGDALVVTGVIGASAARGYRRIPEPRSAIAALVGQYAHAAIDISDGLIADVGHICAASNVVAALMLRDIPLPAQIGGISVEALLTGGDDYELALAIAPQDVDDFIAASQAQGVPAQVIGAFANADDRPDGATLVRVYEVDGQVVEFKNTGWTHF